MNELSVLHIVPCLDSSYGGSVVSAPSLASAMMKWGWRSAFVSVATTAGETKNALMEKHRPSWRECRRGGVDFGHYSPDTYRTLVKAVEEFRPSVVHMHSIFSHITWMAFRAARRRNLPIIISPRSELFTESLRRSPRKKLVARLLYADALMSYASAYHATDELEAEGIRRLQPTKQVFVVPNGVDLELGTSLPSKSVARLRRGLPQDRKVLLFLSRIHERKNPMLLLTAAVQERIFERGWDLVIAGPEEDLELGMRLRRAAAEAGVGGRVHFVGLVDWQGKQDYYAASDLFVLPSEFENFGNVIAEALACRLPVLTTTGTPWRGLGEKGAGELVDLHEPNAWNDALSKWTKFTSEELSARGSHGPSLVQGLTWDAAAEAMSGAYASIAGERGTCA